MENSIGMPPSLVAKMENVCGYMIMCVLSPGEDNEHVSCIVSVDLSCCLCGCALSLGSGLVVGGVWGLDGVVL